jgi:Fe-S cluster biogenesis protein NfuA
MFIQTEETPNPATLKFLPGREVVASGSVDFATRDGAGRSPLAERLFKVDGIERVFFGQDFITVTKAPAKDWTVLKPALLGVIMEHFVSGQPTLLAEAPAGSGAVEEEDDEIVAQIKDLLETRVRPAVAQDGGDITFQGFRDGVVFLNMRGSCAGCPSSTATLKHGIENLLKHFVPEVREIQEVAG